MSPKDYEQAPLFKNIFLILLLFSGVAQADALKPKYQSGTVPLSIDSGYFRSNRAPDFWVLMPYYMAQQDGKSCSLASSVMVMNAIRSTLAMTLTSEDSLLTQTSLLEKSKSELWKKNLGPLGQGVTLDELKSVIEASIRSLGVNEFEVRLHRVDGTGSEALKSLRKDLSTNEKTSLNFMIINYLQGLLTGDAAVGHIAPIGAYDDKKHRVLVLDPDREWYEPYWVSDELLLKSMATLDSISKKNRGYLFIRLGRQ